jgi:hypothetical protein
MTKSEFIEEAKSFSTGSMVVVSGKDIAAVMQLLNDAASTIESTTPNQALVFNAKETVLYTQRYYETDTEQARLFEFIKVVSSGTFVSLVGNEFDRDATGANRWGKRNVATDTCLDIYDAYKVKDIRAAFSPLYGITREIWAFMTHLYHYDTGTEIVTFVKNQDPDR